MVFKDWRRKYIRMTCFLPSFINYSVLLHYDAGSKHSDGWGVIQDISMGGIKIETRVPFQDGQEVFMSFSISENFTFTNIKCVVKRVVQEGLYYLCGLEFVNLSDRQHLRDALEYLSSFCHD